MPNLVLGHLACSKSQKCTRISLRGSVIKDFMQSVEAVDTEQDFGQIWLSSRL